MKKVLLNIFGFILPFAIQITAQQFSTGSPEWLVDMFFNKSEFPDKANYLSSEMLSYINEPTIGEELNGNGEIFFHQIKSENNEIVFAVEVNQNQKVIDFYCYLIKQDNAWKIFSIRRFLLPDFIFTVRDSLSEISSISSNDSSFYLSLKLFTMPDVDLIDYLKTNVSNFQELVSSFNNNQKDQADKALALVGCNAIYIDKNYPGCVFIQILRFENMATGFIYAGEIAKLPEIFPDYFIYIEKVDSSWYVYRVM